ncbi:alpha/beta hydrolase [Yinghuangia soli]|uniref:Alpha/beta hydrolase n=1 Tax=Yinghuangia soli TaxID=2908204 RepID=A0AA41PUV6_9ACTN|nr:alpha/beta hydrolase [Yinghuangia soli]MCF2525636.1 alpha/beta hydrolase [Yinghuangia soli]
MPLNAELAALLAAVPLVPFTGDPVAVRAQMSAQMQHRPVTTPLERVEDRTIPGPEGAPALPVRIYAPSTEPGLPVVVFFHGGGFCIGGIDSHDPVARKMAEQVGCLVVSVDYRLAPEHPFPAAHEDAYAAYAWVRAHAAELGGDPARVAVAGDSAGGSLSAAVCLMARDRGVPQPEFQLLWYPATDLSAESHQADSEDPLLPQTAMDWFTEHFFSKIDEADLVPYASVGLAEDLSGLAPALIVVAGVDPLHDQGVAYAARLAEAGVPAVLEDYEDMSHGFVSFADFVPPAAKATEGSYAALRAAFGTA